MRKSNIVRWWAKDKNSKVALGFATRDDYMGWSMDVNLLKVNPERDLPIKTLYFDTEKERNDFIKRKNPAPA